MKKLFLFIVLVCFISHLSAQTTINSDGYLKKSIDGYFHFFYDQQYYLVDENCEYRNYTRVVKYEKEKGGFNGFFTDYYNNGSVFLTGNFNAGKKDGNFKAFYPSGKPKYSINFKNDIQTGVWDYYYPSGNLWYQIEFKNNKIYIKNYINDKGISQISNGKGKYSYKEEAIGFNQYGYQAVVYRGKVKNELLQGLWQTSFVYNANHEDLIGTEFFADGEFKESYYFFPEGLSNKASLIKVYPTFIEDNASLFIYKNCTIDDNQGYNYYLQSELNKAFSTVISASNFMPQAFSVKVEINGKGIAQKITLPNDIPEQLKSITKRTLENVNYWIPSFKDQKTISDTLNVKLELNLDENGQLYFLYPAISRENGR